MLHSSNIFVCRTVSVVPYFNNRFPLNYQGEEGDETVGMAMENPHKFVLKPQREGGGKFCILQIIIYWSEIKICLDSTFICYSLSLHMTFFNRKQHFWRRNSKCIGTNW